MHWNHESPHKLLMHLANFQKGSPPIRWPRFLKIHYACMDAGKEREQDAVSFAHQYLAYRDIGKGREQERKLYESFSRPMHNPG